MVMGAEMSNGATEGVFFFGVPFFRITFQEKHHPYVYIYIHLYIYIHTYKYNYIYTMYIHLFSQNIQLGLSQNLDPQNSMLSHWLHLCPQQYHARSLDCVFPWSSKINLDPPTGQTLPFRHLLWWWKVGRGSSMGSNTLWCYPSVLCCRTAKTFRWSTTVFGGWSSNMEI